MSKNTGRANLVIRLQPLTETPDELLIDYLKQHPITPVNDLVLTALRPFWLPLAYQKLGDVTDAQLKQLGRDAIYALEQHINYLRSSLELEKPSLAQTPELAALLGNLVAGGANTSQGKQQSAEQQQDHHQQLLLESGLSPDSELDLSEFG